MVEPWGNPSPWAAGRRAVSQQGRAAEALEPYPAEEKLTILARLATRTARHLRAGTKVAAAIALVLLTAHLTACPPLHAKPGQYTVNVTGTSQGLSRTLSLKLALDCPK